MAEIVYPESLFTGLSLQLMLMRFEIQDAEKQGAGLAPQDMSGIFSVLCALDNRVIAAQKARGYSDAEPFERLDKEPWNKNVGTAAFGGGVLPKIPKYVNLCGASLCDCGIGIQLNILLRCA